jgi:dCTP deaminase
MGVLSDRLIKRMLDTGKLKIQPFNPDQLQPATYDLRIGPKILASPTSPMNLGKVVQLTKEKPTFNIESGQMVGVISLERLELSLDMSARFGIRSSLARMGLNAFGGLQLDPGFKGRLIMNLLNVGPEPVTISLDQVLFSVEFASLDEPAEKGYSGPYQDQDDFPADQYNYILCAHTTSLAEIPTLRKDIERLSSLIEDLEERLPDPDRDLELKPEVRAKLEKSLKLQDTSLISLNEIRSRINNS